MNIKKLYLILLFSSIAAFVQAQTTYEIRAVNKGTGFVGVEMRMTAGTPPTTANFITDLVFGLKWQSTYNVDLVSTITTSYAIVKSDVRKQKSTYYYQAFSAANTPFSFPVAWTVNNWVEIMTIKNTLTGTGTGIFEIAETGFDVTTDPNFGVDLTDYTPAIVGSATGIILPVNLTQFQVIPFGRAINIQWSTAGEQNNKGFEVQRSQEEGSNFEKIGWVSSKGSSGSENKYEFTDRQVAVKVKYYYRLKQVDNDDKYSYSDVRTAILEELDNTDIRIIPNPVDEVLHIFFNNTIAGKESMIKVIDTKGAIVLQKNYDIRTSRKIDLNVSGLISGQYFLSIENNKGLIYTKAFNKK